MRHLSPTQLNHFFKEYMIDNEPSVPSIDLPDAAIQHFKVTDGTAMQKITVFAKDYIDKRNKQHI